MGIIIITSKFYVATNQHTYTQKMDTCMRASVHVSNSLHLFLYSVSVADIAVCTSRESNAHVVPLVGITLK